jgi:hypothetical protein
MPCVGLPCDNHRAVRVSRVGPQAYRLPRRWPSPPQRAVAMLELGQRTRHTSGSSSALQDMRLDKLRNNVHLAPLSECVRCLTSTAQPRLAPSTPPRPALAAGWHSGDVGGSWMHTHLARQTRCSFSWSLRGKRWLVLTVSSDDKAVASFSRVVWMRGGLHHSHERRDFLLGCAVRGASHQQRRQWGHVWCASVHA